jgi:hypothetical protein
MTDPDHLEADQQVRLKDARARCPHLDALAGHVTEFAKILTGLRGEHLGTWIDQVNADDLPALHSFTASLKTDYAAVVNGLSMTHNSGAVEGNVNRIKMIKRQMYGRAKFDLLRKRVLLATCAVSQRAGTAIPHYGRQRPGRTVPRAARLGDCHLHCPGGAGAADAVLSRRAVVGCDRPHAAHGQLMADVGRGIAAVIPDRWAFEAIAGHLEVAAHTETVSPTPGWVRHRRAPTGHCCSRSRWCWVRGTYAAVGRRANGTTP